MFSLRFLNFVERVTRLSRQLRDLIFLKLHLLSVFSAHHFECGAMTLLHSLRVFQFFEDTDSLK